MIEVNVSSLQGFLLKENADIIVVPGKNGDIGIAESDRYLTYLLKEGVIYFIKNDKVFKRIFVFDGRFLSDKNKVYITTDSNVIDLQDINENQIKDRIKSVELKISKCKSDFERKFYSQSLEKEKLLLNVYKEKLY